MPKGDTDLDTLVRQVQEAEKYRHISLEFIRSLLAKETAKGKSQKEIIKSTRNKLHQVGSAYQEKSIPYSKWIEELQQLPNDFENPLVIDFLKKALAAHASTQERLPILSRFFRETLNEIAPIHTLLDVACGLNPLSIPWMPLASSFRYFACDIYEDMANFLNLFFEHFKIKGEVKTCNLIQQVPNEKAEVALVLKTIPCLEQVDKEAGYHILSQLQTDNILVSFPAKSLGGKSKGMVQNYERHFNELVAGQSWKIARSEFPGELAFLIRK